MHVVTKCCKITEAAFFGELDSALRATEQIERTCMTVPIHVIFGARNDLMYVLCFSVHE
jgi:hypothetical protein